MSGFSNRFSIGDTVHASISDHNGSFKGEIVGASDVGLTIEFEQQHNGKKALRFIPWTSLSNRFKPID